MTHETSRASTIEAVEPQQQPEPIQLEYQKPQPIQRTEAVGCGCLLAVLHCAVASLAMMFTLTDHEAPNSVAVFILCPMLVPIVLVLWLLPESLQYPLGSSTLLAIPLSSLLYGAALACLITCIHRWRSR